MANEVDDMSADPDRGILEPERAHSAPSAGAVPRSDGSAMTSGTQPIGSARAQTAVLRQGLPRTGAYRASAVRRSPHPTPVATPIVTVTPVPTTPVAAPSIEPPPVDPQPEPIAGIAPPPSSIEPAAGSMVSDAGSEVEAADPRASGDAVLHAPDGRTESTPLASAHTASSTPAIAAVPSAPIAEPARVRTDVAARSIGHRALRIGLGLLGAAVLGGVIVLSALGSSRNDAHPGSRSALPAAADLVHAVSSPAPAIEVAAPRTAGLPHAASAAPLLLVTPSPAAKREPPAATPVKPAAMTAGDAAPPPAKPSPPAGAAPAHPDSSTARSGAAGDPSPARPGATREPPRAAKPAGPPRPSPARPLTYDPDALFLPKQ